MRGREGNKGLRREGRGYKDEVSGKIEGAENSFDFFVGRREKMDHNVMIPRDYLMLIEGERGVMKKKEKKISPSQGKKTSKIPSQILMMLMMMKIEY